MRVLKKPKNPTFNEYFPPQFSEGSQPTFLFESVFFNDETTINKIMSLYNVDINNIDDYIMFEASFDENLRNLYGSREVDDTILQDVFAKIMVDDTHYTQLSWILFRYKYKWNKLLDNVYSQVYNPIENYDRQEDSSLSYEGAENVTRNVDSNRKLTGTTADTRNDTSSAESNSQKNVFAFDSSEASPSDSDSGRTTATGTGSSNSTVDNTDTEKRTETEGHSFTNRKNVTASRIHGNIGITTNQQMMTAELEFRIKNDFFNTVYEDIANAVLKPIY